MAVQQGYGKMAGTDALVFAYDTGDAVNSYKGEPATNYLSAGLNNITAFAASAWKGATLTQVGTSVFDTPIFSYATEGTSYTYTNDNVLDDDLATLSQQTVTFSLYIRRIEGPATCQIRIYDNNSGYTYQTRSVTTQFTRIEMTKTIGTSPTRIFVMLDNTGGGTYEFHSTQLELNSKATPFVNGTRSATEGLLDLTGNEIIDLSTVGFNSNGDIEFDATNDYISINNTTVTAGPYTILMIVKPGTALTPGGSGSGKPNGTNRHTPLVGPGPVWNPGIWVTSDYIRSHADTQYTDSAINWTTGWQMIGMTYDGTNVKNILGGQVLPNAHVTAYDPPVPSELLLGAEKTGGSSVSWDGSIAVVNFYNRVLSPAEIQNNFNRYKTRFNIA